MRVAVLFAASLLVAGCSQISGTPPRATQLTPITPTRAAGSVPTTSTGQPETSASPAPAPGAPVAEAIDWVEAAGPVDSADFRVALRGGTTTPLGDDVAFTTPYGISCMTDAKHGAPGLACLVNLIDPPPQPADVYGAWKGGWVDFDGGSVQVGSAHGDPGRFAAGQGAPLPVDRSLSFGDFRCRTDTSALVCVNFARQSAVYYSDAGIDTFGCTRQSSPPAGIGVQYTC
jgi:hypothetical protein